VFTRFAKKRPHSYNDVSCRAIVQAPPRSAHESPIDFIVAAVGPDRKDPVAREHGPLPRAVGRARPGSKPEESTVFTFVYIRTSVIDQPAGPRHANFGFFLA